LRQGGRALGRHSADGRVDWRHWVANSAWAGYLTFNPHQMDPALVAYGFIASILPVWLLLTPRGYLSTYLKLGMIASAAYWHLHCSSEHSVPARTAYAHGGGPIIGGTSFSHSYL